MIIEEELELAIKRLQKMNPHIDPDEIRKIVLEEQHVESDREHRKSDR